jgi:hypothetical protein
LVLIEVIFMVVDDLLLLDDEERANLIKSRLSRQKIS